MEPSKLQQQTVEMVGAYDERKRTFDVLRNLSLSDEKRAKAIEDYKRANAEFERQKSALLK